MANNNDLILDVGADTKPAQKEIEELPSKIPPSVGQDIAKNIGQGLVGLFAADKIKDFFVSSIEEAVNAEQSLKLFNQQLKNAGQYSEEVSASFQAFAQSLQNSTGIADDAILKNAGQLATLGKLSGQALRDATQAALDLSTGMQISVEQAFDVMTKAANGNARALKAYGLDVKDAKTNADVFGQTLEYVNKHFKGAAQENLKGYSGQIKILSNQWNDFKESVGNAIIQNETLNSALSGLLKYVIEPLTKGLLALITVITGAIQIVPKFISMLAGGPNNTAGINAYVKSVDDLGNSLRSILADQNNVAQSNVKLAAGTENLNKLTEDQTQKLKQQAAAAAEAAKQQQELSRAAFETYTQYQLSQPTFENMVIGFKEGMQEMVKTTRELGKALGQTLVNGMTNAFASIGSNLAKGKGAFNDFGKNMLSMLGSMAIMVGQFLVLAGTGLAALPFGFSGFGAIAAGLGLIVLGGVLQALGGGGGESATAQAASDQGGGATPTIDTSLTKEEERMKAQTGIQVIVQGNILDRRETGLELVKIINENFDTNGTVIRGFA